MTYRDPDPGDLDALDDYNRAPQDNGGTSTYKQTPAGENIWPGDFDQEPENGGGDSWADGPPDSDQDDEPSGGYTPPPDDRGRQRQPPTDGEGSNTSGGEPNNQKLATGPGLASLPWWLALGAAAGLILRRR